MISRVSGRPFARCFKCNKAHVRPLLLRQHQLHPPPPYHLLLNTKKAQATILATTAAYNLQLSSEYTDYTQSYQLPTDYSILTVTTASQANAWIIDSGASINCTYDINDIIQPVQLFAPIPITSASGQALFATHVGQSFIAPALPLYLVPDSTAKLLSLGIFIKHKFSYFSNPDETLTILDPERSHFCTCPMMSNNTWTLPVHLLPPVTVNKDQHYSPAGTLVTTGNQ